MNQQENDALEALRAAVWALERAQQKCAAVGYGSEVRGTLEDAHKALAYAVALVEDRV